MSQQEGRVVFEVPPQAIQLTSYGGRLSSHHYALFHCYFVMLENPSTGTSPLNNLISEMRQMIEIPTSHISTSTVLGSLCYVSLMIPLG